jgi:subtilisin family serine protease
MHPWSKARQPAISGTRDPKAALRFTALAAFALLGAISAFAADPASRFQEYDGLEAAKPSRLAVNLSDQPVHVVVVLSENSVAGARALSPTLRLSDDERNGVESRAKAQHAQVRPHVEARGAMVLKSFHSAINGLKVEVKPSQIAALSAIPGVTRVLPVARHERNNSQSVPYIGTPAVWAGLPGYRGEGVKVAIIDTGIDYTHANFGGPGTPAAFAAADANSTAPADPALFGPGAPKVKGGIDLVGDAYTGFNTPVPDPNPLDCNGHGSHVAGTVAGFGVTGAGATYTGPYNAAAYVPGAFNIGPGVAPRADLYAVRVFGCSGSTEIVVDAIDWAVANDMDVINMSLGSAYGDYLSADALAAEAATAAGVIVVASAGNSGGTPYITGTPAAGDGVISVAAIDGRPSFPGAVVTLASGATINAQVSNGVALPSTPLTTVVLRNADGSVSLGCSAAEYAGTAGKLVVTLRGVCARADRATFGQAAGAAAVALINNGAGYGIYEGPIPGVAIPFLGIQPSDAAALTGSASETLAATVLNNAFVGTVASFSSGGPRVGDSALKPSVSAPGVSVFSTNVGTGNGAIAESGTSMAAPHVAGVAALTTQAHPRWNERELAAAITQTAAPSKLPDYLARVEGAGLVQPLAATQTQTIVSIEEDPSATAISFGFAEFTGNYKATKQLRITNKGRHRASFNIAATPTSGDPHSLSLSNASITVGAGETESVKVTLSVAGSTAGDSTNFNEVAGLVTLTPASPADNNGVTLTLPYYLVERARSATSAEWGGNLSPRRPTANVRLKNEADAAQTGYADFYAWGLAGTLQGAAPFDIRAVGVQAFPITATNSWLIFAVNTFDRFNTSAIGEVDIYLDTDGDGVDDWIVFNTTNTNHVPMVALVNLHTGVGRLVSFAIAPTDGSTLLMPVQTRSLGLTLSNPRLTYKANSWNQDNVFNAVPGVASFNAFSPAISNGDYVPLVPGASASVPVTLNPAEWALTPALGVMVVDQENHSGAAQAALLRAGR